MRKILPIIAFAALAAGCNMASPGVAHLGPPLTPEAQQKTTYNSLWVNTVEPDPINTLDRKGELSIDLSERELGVRYLDEDSMIGDKYEPGYKKRQREREEARRAAWKQRMGLKTMKDEQDERDGKVDKDKDTPTYDD